MALIDAVKLAVQIPTWSIREAAYFVHNLDPKSATETISVKSPNEVSKTYYWLKKELQHSRIEPVTNEDGEARFVPGTLMRRLDNEKRFFQKSVLQAYLKHGVQTGPSSDKYNAWMIYRRAALLIHINYPTVPKAAVAGHLVELPKFYKAWKLPSFAIHTIRNHIADLWKSGKGAPPKHLYNPNLKFDWDWLIKELH